MQRPRVAALFTLALIGAVIGALAFTDDAGRAALGLQREAVLGGEVWRLLTAHLVHLTRAHAGMNILGLVLLAVLLWPALEPGRLLFACAASALAISLGCLIFLPHLESYVGWSGITHGVIAWGGLRLWQMGTRGFAAILLTGLAIKIGWETVMGPTPGASEAIGGVILLESHLYGTIGGIFAGLWPLLRAGLQRALALGLTVCLMAPEARAHTDDATMATLYLDSEIGLILSLDLETAAFVLREPAGPLSPVARARLDGLSEAELQDYIDGAGTYLLQNVRLLDREDESAAPVLATRIRMPTPPQLRRHAEADDGSAAHRLPLLLAFDPDAVTALGAPALQLPPLIGDIVFVSESPDGTRSVEMLSPGQLSQPLAAGLLGAGGARTLWLSIAGVFLVLALSAFVVTRVRQRA
ncbi:MAG: rhombosortase [Pseudomonadota bacterium]